VAISGNKRKAAERVKARLGTFPALPAQRRESALPAWLIIALFLVVVVALKKTVLGWHIELFSLARLVGSCTTLLVAAALFGFYLLNFEKHIASDRKRLFGAGLLFLIFLILGEIIGSLTGEKAQHLSYLLPVCVFAVLAVIFFGQRFAFIFVLSCLALLCFSPKPFTEPLFNWTLFGSLASGGLAAVFAARRLDTRTKLIKVGLYAGVAHFLSIFGLNMASIWAADEFRASVITSSRLGLYGLLNGVFCGFFLSGFLPFIERVFKLSTDIRLKELSDLNQSFLRRFLLEAPGTYHHSLLVGTLSEAAAQGIRANPLLARVGAYFHDVGKINKPDYFTENEQIKGQRHALLSPHLSTLIIVSHVRDGMEIARELKLPESVINIIREHHGTSLVEYFYREAAEGKKGKDVRIPAESFRYPGPRPTSKEAAIVMLADSVEAASRTLESRSPHRIENLVHEIVMRRLSDGQLDESNLTLTELKRSEEAFTRVLVGIFHSRVDYRKEPPSPSENEKRRQSQTREGHSITLGSKISREET
jgi:hypothetical protein